MHEIDKKYQSCVNNEHRCSQKVFCVYFSIVGNKGFTGHLWSSAFWGLKLDLFLRLHTSSQGPPLDLGPCKDPEVMNWKFWQFDEILQPSFDSGNPYVSTFLSVPSIRPFSKRYQRLLIKHLMLPICFTRSRRRLLPWEDCGWVDLPVGPLLGWWP